jgi:hypothetical protein
MGLGMTEGMPDGPARMIDLPGDLPDRHAIAPAESHQTHQP